MNGKKGSIEINIQEPKNTKQMGMKSENKSLSIKEWIINVWEFGKADINRVIFSLKVGLAVLLVSLLILFRAPYEVFGANIIWSILTVAIMFEYTVGATFNRGFNRAVGSLLAGVLAVAVAQVAIYSGPVAEPSIIGASIFLIGAVTSFMKLWPSLAPYEYGFRVILFTYCLIIVSGYRMGGPITTAMDRLYAIAIGAFVAVFVNTLVFPIWAGEQLHNELVKNFNAVADALEECIKKYLDDDGSDHPEFSKTVMDEFPDEPAYRRCQATLNSSSKLDALASSAKWEPPHGRFWHFSYPWGEYVKVGAVLRYCAYEVMALHGVLHAEIQAPQNLRIAFRMEILDASNNAAELVRSLGKEISNMVSTPKASLLLKVHTSTEHLQRAIDMHSYLLTSIHEDLSISSKTLSHTLSTKLSHTPSTKLSRTPSTKLSHTLSSNLSDLPSLELPTSTAPTQTESYHESMKKSQRRLYSWPSRELDAFDESGLEMDNVPRMKALESTAAMSLATFSSILIEFVARIDHLVESVNDLAKMAKFKHENV
ncbi:hypothetical protein ACHQM5_000370 [Ranunculus cassubicifolius]